MSWLSEPPHITESGDIDCARFHDDIRPAAKPIVMRGLVADWPSVAAGRTGDAAMVAYLYACGAIKPVKAIAAAPEHKGRFFYNDDLTRLNFVSGQGNLGHFLQDLLLENEKAAPGAMAVQSEVLRAVSPNFTAENQLALLPDVDARIWIGNRARVAIHFDLTENVACNVAGHRRFMLFPPDQIANLYLGPLELTPAGTPCSLVDPLNPDLARFPRFAEAWKHVQIAMLAPGDAIYIPYGWWHGVDSLDPLNILVNYWWNNPHEGMAPPYDALLHAVAAYRHLPAEQRAVWRSINDYFAFSDFDPGAHLPDVSKGLLAPYSPQLLTELLRKLRAQLG